MSDAATPLPESPPIYADPVTSNCVEVFGFGYTPGLTIRDAQGLEGALLAPLTPPTVEGTDTIEAIDAADADEGPLRVEIDHEVGRFWVTYDPKQHTIFRVTCEDGSHAPVRYWLAHPDGGETILRWAGSISAVAVDMPHGSDKPMVLPALVDLIGSAALGAMEAFNSCNHGVEFDPDAAASLTVPEIRERWPRLDGPCPKGCGFSGIHYASTTHYAAGDW